MGGQSIVYVHNINVLFHLLSLFTRGGWVVQKGQISVYVVIEWPLWTTPYKMTFLQKNGSGSKKVIFKLFSGKFEFVPSC